MQKVIKITAIVIFAIMLCTIATSVYAADTGKTIGGVTINPNTTKAGTEVNTIGNKILGIVQVVGTVIAVGALMVLGVKYMMGSAEEKAEYKKTMIPYVIGAILLFAAVHLASWFANIAGTLTTG